MVGGTPSSLSSAWLRARSSLQGMSMMSSGCLSPSTSSPGARRRRCCCWAAVEEPWGPSPSSQSDSSSEAKCRLPRVLSPNRSICSGG